MPISNLLSKSLLPVTDFTLARLPRRVHQQLIGKVQLLTALFVHGGQKGFLEHASALGFRGKWKCDELDVGGDGTELTRELGESWLWMKGRQKVVSAAYHPAPTWASILDAEWVDPRKDLEAGNFEAFEVFLRNFFRNGAISGLWGVRGMFEEFVAASRWDDLQRLELFMRQFEAWRREVPGGSLDDLDEARVGNPWGYNMNGRLIVEPAFEYHSLALRIRDLVTDVANPVVLEIGGGFGGLARQILRLIPGVRYIGLDLPENVVIQSWYLSRSLPKRRIRSAKHRELTEADATLLPNWAIEDLHLPRLDVVVNAHSFGEMNLDTLHTYFSEVTRLRPEWIYHDNLSLPRRDGFYGLLAPNFPPFQGYQLITSCESRWPRYNHRSTYPCREYLFRSRKGSIW